MTEANWVPRFVSLLLLSFIASASKIRHAVADADNGAHDTKNNNLGPGQVGEAKWPWRSRGRAASLFPAMGLGIGGSLGGRISGFGIGGAVRGDVSGGVPEIHIGGGLGGSGGTGDGGISGGLSGEVNVGGFGGGGADSCGTDGVNCEKIGNGGGYGGGGTGTGGGSGTGAGGTGTGGGSGTGAGGTGTGGGAGRGNDGGYGSGGGAGGSGSRTGAGTGDHYSAGGGGGGWLMAPEWLGQPLYCTPMSCQNNNGAPCGVLQVQLGFGIMAPPINFFANQTANGNMP